MIKMLSKISKSSVIYPIFCCLLALSLSILFFINSTMNFVMDICFSILLFFLNLMILLMFLREKIGKKEIVLFLSLLSTTFLFFFVPITLNQNRIPLAGTDAAHHIYWSKYIAQNRIIPNYFRASFGIEESNKYSPGIHIFFGFLGMIINLDLMFFIPVFMYFVNILILLSIFLFTDKISDSKSGILASFFYGTMSNLMFKRIIYGNYPEIAAEFITPLLLMFFIRCLNNNRKYFYSFLFLFFIIFIVHNLTALIITVVIFTMSPFFLYEKYKKNTLILNKKSVIICFIWFVVFLSTFLVIYDVSNLLNLLFSRISFPNQNLIYPPSPLRILDIIGLPFAILLFIETLFYITFRNNTDLKFKFLFKLLIIWIFVLLLLLQSKYTGYLWFINPYRILNYLFLPLSILCGLLTSALKDINLFINITILHKYRIDLTKIARLSFLITLLVFSSFNLLSNINSANSLINGITVRRTRVSLNNYLHMLSLLKNQTTHRDIILVDITSDPFAAWVRPLIMRQTLINARLTAYRQGKVTYGLIAKKIINTPSDPIVPFLLQKYNISWSFVREEPKQRMEKSPYFIKVYEKGSMAIFRKQKYVLLAQLSSCDTLDQWNTEDANIKLIKDKNEGNFSICLQIENVTSIKIVSKYKLRNALDFRNNTFISFWFKSNKSIEYRFYIWDSRGAARWWCFTPMEVNTWEKFVIPLDRLFKYSDPVILDISEIGIGVASSNIVFCIDNITLLQAS